MLMHNCSANSRSCLQTPLQPDQSMRGFRSKVFRRFAVGSVMLFLILTSAYVFARTRVHARAPIRFDLGLLADGDLIFRRGVSFESNVIMTLDGYAPFSHVGIIKKQGGEFRVIHVVTDEPKGSPDVTRIESLDVFLGAERASAAAVYRVRLSEQHFVSDASQLAAEYAAARVPFDSNFDLSSADALYCTELVWRVFRDAGLDLTDNKRDTIRTPLGRGQYLLPGTLLESSHLQLVWTSTN